MTPWYLASVKVQKLFIIIMMRSVKPSYLSVGGWFVLTNEFFLIVSINKEEKGYIYDNKKKIMTFFRK